MRDSCMIVYQEKTILLYGRSIPIMHPEVRDAGTGMTGIPAG